MMNEEYQGRGDTIFSSSTVNSDKVEGHPLLNVLIVYINHYQHKRY